MYLVSYFSYLSLKHKHLPVYLRQNVFFSMTINYADSMFYSLKKIYNNEYTKKSYYSLINSLVGTQGTSHLLTSQQYSIASLTVLSLHSNNINVSCGYFFLVYNYAVCHLCNRVRLKTI